MYRSSSLPSGWGPLAGGIGIAAGCLIGLIVCLIVKFGSEESENPPPENINLRIFGAAVGVVVGIIMIFSSSAGDAISLSSKLDQKVSFHMIDALGYKDKFYIVQNDLTTKSNDFEYRIPLGEYLEYANSKFGDVYFLKGTGPKFAVHELYADWVLSRASKKPEKKIVLENSSKNTSYLRKLLESEEEDQEYLILVPSFEKEFYMVWDKESIPVMLESQGYDEERKAEFYDRYRNKADDDPDEKAFLTSTMLAFYYILGEKHDSNGIILNAGTDHSVFYDRYSVADLFKKMLEPEEEETEGSEDE